MIVLVPVVALVAASLMSNEISPTTLIEGIALAGLIALAIMVLIAISTTAGTPFKNTIGFLSMLTLGISIAEPLDAKNGEIEVRQRFDDCEAQIAALRKNAR